MIARRCLSRLLLVGLLLPVGFGGAARAAVDGPLGAALDRYLGALVAYGYSGAALVAQHGKVLLDQGYGLADRARGVPFTADTLFDIASISKPFTAAAVLRLEMQGKLRVDDPLSRFFPAAPPDKAGITLHQLLTHTAGLPESLGEEYEPLGRDAFLKRLFSTPLVHPPGRRFLYSNAGYSLLAAVVEVVSGRPFGEFLRTEIFAPAGMRHTGFLPEAADRARLAHGYTLEGDWGTSLDHPIAPDGPFWNLRGNGGLLTTTGDLYRWHVALQGDSVLSAAERQKYQRPYVPETHAAHPRYAYGWSVSPGPDGKRMLAHVGSNGVFQADFRRYPDDDAVIVTVTNSTASSAIAVADQLERRLFARPHGDPPAVAALPEAALRRCAGTYALPSGEPLAVAVEAGRLAVTPAGSDGLALLGGAEAAHGRRFAERDRQIGDSLTAARRGELGPLAEALGTSPALATARWHTLLAAGEKALGAWQGESVLGTVSQAGRVVTYARLAFARGTRVLEAIWAGPTAESLSLGPALRPTFFLPEPAGRFATYDVGTDAIVRLECVGAGDSASALRVQGAAGTSTLPRRTASDAPR